MPCVLLSASREFPSRPCPSQHTTWCSQLTIGVFRLPLAFYLKLFGHELGTGERLKVWLVMSLSFILSVVGTVWAFIPKSLIGAEPIAK